jgi:hypothetical protein
MEGPVKRVIDGLSYNTATSTLVARSDWVDRNERSPYYGCPCTGELYQTQGRAFFVVTTITTRKRDEDGEPIEKVEFEPLSADEALSWTLTGETEIIRDAFGEPPEAEAEDKVGATLYIRVPAALKRSVDEAVKKAGVSGNVWAKRCIERCLDFPPQLAEIFWIASGLSAPWRTDEIGKDVTLDQYKLELATKALDEIGERVLSFAKERFGTDDLMKISGAERILMDGDLTRRYQPYPY